MNNLLDELIDVETIKEQYTSTIASDPKYREILNEIDNINEKIIKSINENEKRELIDKMFFLQSSQVNIYRKYDIIYNFCLGIAIASAGEFIKNDKFKNALINKINSLINQDEKDE